MSLFSPTDNVFTMAVRMLMLEILCWIHLASICDSSDEYCSGSHGISSDHQFKHEWKFESLTFRLYGSFSQGLTWCQTQQFCLDKGFTMATVTNEDIHKSIETKLKNISAGSIPTVWLGARRRTKGKWAWIEDKSVTDCTAECNQLDNSKSVYATRLSVATKPENKKHKKCYFICFNEDKPEEVSSWYVAMSSCNGSLAKPTGNISHHRYWLPLYYRPWLWIISEAPVLYFHDDLTQNISENNEDCLAMTSNKWVYKDCKNTQFKTVLCMESPRGRYNSDSTPRTDGSNTTSEDSDNIQIFRPGTVAAVVIVCLLVIAIAVGLILRWKWSKVTEMCSGRQGSKADCGRNQQHQTQQEMSPSRDVTSSMTYKSAVCGTGPPNKTVPCDLETYEYVSEPFAMDHHKAKPKQNRQKSLTLDASNNSYSLVRGCRMEEPPSHEGISRFSLDELMENDMYEASDSFPASRNSTTMPFRKLKPKPNPKPFVEKSPENGVGHKEGPQGDLYAVVDSIELCKNVKP